MTGNVKMRYLGTDDPLLQTDVDHLVEQLIDLVGAHDAPPGIVAALTIHMLRERVGARLAECCSNCAATFWNTQRDLSRAAAGLKLAELAAETDRGALN